MLCARGLSLCNFLGSRVDAWKWPASRLACVQMTGATSMVLCVTRLYMLSCQLGGILERVQAIESQKLTSIFSLIIVLVRNVLLVSLSSPHVI